MEFKVIILKFSGRAKILTKTSAKQITAKLVMYSAGNLLSKKKMNFTMKWTSLWPGQSLLKQITFTINQIKYLPVFTHALSCKLSGLIYFQNFQFACCKSLKSGMSFFDSSLVAQEISVCSSLSFMVNYGNRNAT